MNESADFPIVGVGASAGGIEAFEKFFRHLPAEPGMAFVVVTHLSPDRVSSLPEVIGYSAPMPVTLAKDGEAISPNRIYVIPANSILTVKDGAIHLRPPNPTQRERHPIDIFFGSLAEDRGEKAICVVMSGGGSDGALGVKAIKEAGGLTVAQGTDGSGPGYKEMPDSAVATGFVDIILPAEEIGAKLVDYVNSRVSLDAVLEAERNSNERQTLREAQDSIYGLLRHQTGHDFSGYKQKTFMRRVERRMKVLQVTKLEEYVALVEKEEGEVVNLFRDLLIGVTSFFRDEAAFDALATLVVPKLFEGKGASDMVRVWVPGCSTGEEAYSIAILMREHMDTLKVAPRVQIFATDIDEAALAVARSGRYPEAMMGGVSSARRDRFFTGDGISIPVKEIRDLCVFSAHSLIRDPPFSRVDLISCRNLLIYLGGGLHDQVFPVFHYALRPGGYLFLGNSENISHNSQLFASVDKAQRVFQRRDGATAYPGAMLTAPSGAAQRLRLGNRAVEAASQMSTRLIERRVLDRFAPSHVVVDGAGDVVSFSSRTGKFLEAAVGAPNRQLVSMARRGLRQELRAALAHAIETQRTVVKPEVEVEFDGGLQHIRLTIEPLHDIETDPLYLVVFEEAGPPKARGGEESGPHDPADAADPIAALERELRATRERLQTTIEEYETSLEELKSANEELLSVNEEVQSTNEEMETSKEELQSLNEELHTVNLELGQKVDALDTANADLRNLFESTRIATIFLDRNMLIRSFTPAVTEVFRLIPSDRGRPITDISSRLDYEQLRRDIRQVLDSVQPVERDVRRIDGDAHYLMRILPYRNGDNVVDGVLVTFLNVTSVVEAEEHQRLLVAELNHRVKNMLTVISSLASQTLRRAESLEDFGKSFLGRLNALAATYTLVSDVQWSEVSLRDLLLTELKPYDGDARHIELQGPKILLAPRAALSLGLVAHELCTNAVKHGSLSCAGGWVHVAWGPLPDDPKRFEIVWTETDGPPASEPSQTGFGNQLVARSISFELDGTVDYSYRPSGLTVRIGLPFTDEVIRPAQEDGK